MKLLQKKSLCALLVLSSGVITTAWQVNAQTSSDSGKIVIKIKTQGGYSATRLQGEAGIVSQRPMTIQQMHESFQNLLEVLRGHGYFFARIDSFALAVENRKSPARQGTTHVHAGKRWRLQLVAEPPSEESPTTVRRESIGRPGDERRIIEEINRLLQEYARRGYPLSSLSFDSITLDQESAIAFLHSRFDPGPLVTIDSIVVRGNRLTQSKVIARELSIKPGELFQIDEIEDIPERLRRLGIFRSVKSPQLLQDARGRFLLDIEVVEGSSNTFNGVAGYNPGSGNEKGYLTGLIDLNFGNLFGTGRQLGARWEKRSRDTQELQLRYREPWLLSYPLHLTGQFQQLVQDTIYVERRLEIGLEWQVTPRFTISGSLSRQSVSPDSLASERLLLPRSRVLGATFGIAYNSLDDVINPRRGVAYQTAIESGEKSISALHDIPGNTIHRQRLTVDLQVAVPTLRSQVLSIALHGRQVTSGEEFVSITDEYRLGGATTLRGYREEQFRGSRVGWSNIEYRYLLGSRSRAFVFTDLGYFFKQTVAARIEEFKSAYGLGARIETPLGVVGLDYGLGEGDGLLEGKVHVSLVNRF